MQVHPPPADKITTILSYAPYTLYVKLPMVKFQFSPGIYALSVLNDHRACCTCTVLDLLQWDGMFVEGNILRHRYSARDMHQGSHLSARVELLWVSARQCSSAAFLATN